MLTPQTLPGSFIALLLAGAALAAARWPRLALLLGILCWFQYWALDTLQGRLPSELENRPLQIVAEVRGLPEHGPQRSRLRLWEESLDNAADSDFSGMIRVNWYHPRQLPQTGERWRLWVKLKRPHGFANPGGFDYQRWLFRQQLQATGYVQNRLAEPGTGLAADIQRFRQDIASRLRAQVEDAKAAALLLALTLSDRSGFDQDLWAWFRKTGTSHLVAISGLHIGIAALLGWFLGGRAALLSPWLLRRLPAPFLGAAGAILMATLYALLAGFSIPTQRALIMTCFLLAGLAGNRRISPGDSLAGAFTLILLLDPAAILDQGFWLSFSAVAAPLLAFSGRLQALRATLRWVYPQWVAALALMPLLLLMFGQGSLIAPLVNLIMVPWFSLVLVPLTLAATLLQLLFDWDGQRWLEPLARLTLDGLRLAAQLPWADFQVRQVPGPFWLLASLAALLALRPRGFPGRLLMLPLLAPIPQLFEPDRPHPRATGILAAGCRPGSVRRRADRPTHPGL